MKPVSCLNLNTHRKEKGLLIPQVLWPRHNFSHVLSLYSLFMVSRSMLPNSHFHFIFNFLSILLPSSSAFHICKLIISPVFLFFSLFFLTGGRGLLVLFLFSFFPFLYAVSHLYKRVYPSVGPSVRWSVAQSDNRPVSPSVHPSITHELKLLNNANFQ